MEIAITKMDKTKEKTINFLDFILSTIYHYHFAVLLVEEFLEIAIFHTIVYSTLIPSLIDHQHSHTHRRQPRLRHEGPLVSDHKPIEVDTGQEQMMEDLVLHELELSALGVDHGDQVDQWL